MNWDDFQIFLAVAKKLSFAEAAKALQISYSTLARRIELFEKQLGATLFIRQHGLLSLTTEGQAVLAAAGKMSATTATLERELKGIDKRMEGNINVTMTQSLLCSLVLPLMPDFRRKHPHIHVNIDTSREFRDIIKGEADIAIRLTDNHEYKVPDNLLGVRLPSVSVHAYAAKKLAAQVNKGKPPAGTGLIGWDKRINFGKLAAHFGLNDWPLACTIDDTGAQLQAVKDGIGLGILPCYLGDATAEVARVCTDVAPLPALDAWVVAHPDMRNVEKIRAFMKFVAYCFEKNAALVKGLRPQKGK